MITADARGGRVQVRGCGCCLPIPLATVALTAVGLRRAYLRLRAG